MERSVEREVNPEKPSVLEEPRNGLEEREEAMGEEEEEEEERLRFVKKQFCRKYV